MFFEKSAMDRLSEAFRYLREMSAPKNQVAILEKWVDGDAPYSAETISGAMSLGFGVFDRHGTSGDIRQAIRALVLIRIAVDIPASLNATSGWKAEYERLSEADLRKLIRDLIGRLKAPTVRPAVVPKNINPKHYGISDAALADAQSKLKAPSPGLIGDQPPAAPGYSKSRRVRKDYFSKISRRHIILSGHGGFFEPLTEVTLGPRQRIRFYCEHCYPIGNAAAQFIDSRQFPAAVEEIDGGEIVKNYTLLPATGLTLLNKGGVSGDKEFIETQAPTLLSKLIQKPQYDSAIFHWAACRVVINRNHQVCCPTHMAWEPFATACVLKPKPP